MCSLNVTLRGITSVFKPTGHCGRPSFILSTSFSKSRFVCVENARKEFTHYQLNWIVHRQAHTGEFLKPSADRHNNVAPHKSINVPSCKIFVSPKICKNKWHAVRKSGWLSRINRLNWQFEFIQVRLFAVQILILSIRIHLHRLNIHAMVLFRDFRYYRLRTDLSDALSIYHSSLNHRFPHYLAI